MSYLGDDTADTQGAGAISAVSQPSASEPTVVVADARAARRAIKGSPTERIMHLPTRPRLQGRPKFVGRGVTVQKVSASRPLVAFSAGSGRSPMGEIEKKFATKIVVPEETEVTASREGSGREREVVKRAREEAARLQAEAEAQAAAAQAAAEEAARKRRLYYWLGAGAAVAVAAVLFLRR